MRNIKVYLFYSEIKIMWIMPIGVWMHRRVKFDTALKSRKWKLINLLLWIVDNITCQKKIVINLCILRISYRKNYQTSGAFEYFI